MKEDALLLFFGSLFILSEGRSEDKLRQSLADVSSKNRTVMNVCDLHGQQKINLYCFCDNKDVGNASEADCWLFNMGETKDSRVWNWFRSQRHMTKIRFTIRSMSTLPFVPTMAFKLLPELKSIEIVYGNIDTIEPFAFANLTQLQDLELIRNEIVHLKKFSFASLPDLKVITLGENHIRELNREVFVSLPQLRKLYMDRNNMTLIHDGAFSALYSLEELELHQNLLTTVTRDTFRGLKSLRRLDLSSNALTYIAEGTFSEMPHLEELLLERNIIEAVDPGALALLFLLSKLYLAQNCLRTLPPGLFKDTQSLRLINVRENALLGLSYSVFDPIMNNLRNQTGYLIIEGNPLVCDCDLLWLHTLYNETTSEEIRNGIENIICAKPPDDDDWHHEFSNERCSAPDPAAAAAIPPAVIIGGGDDDIVVSSSDDEVENNESQPPSLSFNNDRHRHRSETDDIDQESLGKKRKVSLTDKKVAENKITADVAFEDVESVEGKLFITLSKPSACRRESELPGATMRELTKLPNGGSTIVSLWPSLLTATLIIALIANSLA